VRAAVIGGRLQGLEASYLAGKAGWQVILIDRREDIPARNLCDRFFCLDASRSEELADALEGVNLIIPALENRAVLASLAEVSGKYSIPYACDLAAYDLAASKTRSDRLFSKIGIPAPRPWPHCGFPLIAKPAASSGSEGVQLLQNEAELKSFQARPRFDAGQWVIQEYLEGPSFSIEVIGCGGVYLPLQVTDLEMDAVYDCKRVLAPSGLAAEPQEELANIAVKIAAELKLEGIMDVEVILHDGCLKVLEIDARLPSQTPTAVYKSTGINMLELLAACFIHGRIGPGPQPAAERAVIFEHIVVSPGSLEVTGEHAVAAAGPLAYVEDFFGADEALTNYRPGRPEWLATLIMTGESRPDLHAKRTAVIDRIRSEMRIGPEGVSL
jgi:3-methylornithine--L-lysine ligase